MDDIYTTGATVDEIARVLKEPWRDRDGVIHNGAAKIDCLTFAAGADMVKADRSGYKTKVESDIIAGHALLRQDQ